METETDKRPRDGPDSVIEFSFRFNFFQSRPPPFITELCMKHVVGSFLFLHPIAAFFPRVAQSSPMESMQSLCQELSTMLSQTEVTPDIVEKFKAGSQKLKVNQFIVAEKHHLIPFQANPGLLDDLIGKLSPAAQAPAKKVRTVVS